MAPNGDFEDVGSGVLDFPAMFDTARSGGVRQWLVEHDAAGRSVRVRAEQLPVSVAAAVLSRGSTGAYGAGPGRCHTAAGTGPGPWALSGNGPRCL